MRHMPLASRTLHLFRLVLRRTHPAEISPELDSLTSASFLEHEPDLAKEAGQYTRQASGWAAGGHPTMD